MARLNEITSTEKLLDLIRNKTGAPLRKKGDAEKVVPSVSPSSQGKSKGIPFRKVPFHKPMTVGVDIGNQHLRLLKTLKGADGAPALLDQRCIAIPAGLQPNSVEFANFLREQLTSFCGVSKKLQIWAIMSAASVR